jgi:hypothetical protein
MYLIAGHKLRKQAIQRTMAHIARQKEQGRTELKNLLSRTTDGYNPNHYINDEQKRLDKLIKIDEFWT